MDGQLKTKIEQFVETNIVGFHQARANNLAKLNLNDVLKAKNPYLFRARFLETPEANGVYLHIGGQSFWQLLSGEADLYMQMVEPLGYRAKEFNEAFEAEKAKVYGRMADEFRQTYCRTSGEIDWQKLVEFVSRNLPEQ
jgi:hypothetical protein